jgi:hypothetical protein
MPRKLHIVAGITSLAVAYGLGAYPQRRKYNQLARALLIVGAERDFMSNQMSHLGTILSERDIVLDEFDLIVLNELADLTQEES